jgi:flagellar basal-body rod protein FlgF
VIRGIYTAASGMVVEIDRQNVIANNLANTDTIGFKNDNVVATSFGQMLMKAYNRQGATPIGTMGLGVKTVMEFPDFSDGIITNTNNQCDLAITGNALFAVLTPNGERYQRAGNFEVDRDGYLVTKNGHRVLGEQGEIRVEGPFQVGADGTIYQDGEEINRLMLVDSRNMIKDGEYLYNAPHGVRPATNFEIIQGALERSNVNAIQQMIEMIAVSRSYESSQKALIAHDETLGKAVNELAK